MVGQQGIDNAEVHVDCENAMYAADDSLQKFEAMSYR